MYLRTLYEDSNGYPDDFDLVESLRLTMDAYFGFTLHIPNRDATLIGKSAE